MHIHENANASAHSREHRSDDPFVLTPPRLGRLASPRLVERGVDYALRGRVLEVRARGGKLEARVEGSRGEPYLVSIVDDGDGELMPACTCPFDWEPFCKHAIAALVSHGAAGEAAWKKYLAGPGRGETVEDELKVRKERGRKQPFRVRRLKHGDRAAPPRFAVTSATTAGASYEVEIRSLHRRLNHCSCPDHENSMLGTCKHIEAVLHRIGKQPPAKRSALLPALKGRKALVVLSREGGPRVTLLPPAGGLRGARTGRPAARLFDDAGVLRGDPVRALPILEGEKNIVVCDDVRDFVGKLERDHDRQARGCEVRERLCGLGPSIPGVGCSLFPYQSEGTAFLAANGRALLADDMGLGKTVQAIAAARLLMERGEVSRTLVICPASLKRQWADEIAKFTSCSATVVSGVKAKRKLLYFADTDFVIVNYELVRRDFDLFGDGTFDLMIVDEAQRVKNWRTKTAEAVKAVRSEFVFVLTGTPLENRLDDLYSIMQLIDRRVLGPLWAFNDKFITVERQEGRRVTVYRNLSELRRRLRPVMLRRDRVGVLTQLPERTTNRYYTPITDTQRDLMLDAEAGAAMIAARAAKRPLTPGELRKLSAFLQIARMACNAVRLVDKEGPDESPKLEEFERLVHEVCREAGRKAVVFTQWEIFQRMAAERAREAGVEYVRLHGGVPTHKRGDLIARFRDDPDCRLFLSTDAGGVGLNLQWASVVMNLDLPWNPAVLEQRISRVHRMGQEENVSVFLLTSENSFEHKMEKLLAGKRALFEAAVLPDSDVDVVEVSSAMLAAVREIFEDLDIDEDAGIEEIGEQLGRRYDTAQEGGNGNGMGMGRGARPAEGAAEAAEPGEIAEPAPAGPDIRALLGHRLRCLLRLASGQRIAVVDRVDDAARDAARRAGAAVIDEAAYDALASLGPGSPLAAAAIEEDSREAAAAGAADPRREALMGVAGRKLGAAETMAVSGLGGEAVELARAAMEAALKAKALETGKEAATLSGLLYEVLLPEGLITMEQAGLASRAEGVARAYAESPAPPPAALVGAVLEDAKTLVGAMAG